MMDTERFRERLGARLVLWSTGALVLLGIAALAGAAVAKGADAFQQTAQLLLSSLLPLFGTWVGTVLAFYYSKENFQAASANALDLVRIVAQKLSATRVGDQMMRRGNIIAETIPAGKSIGDLMIAAVEKRFMTIGANGQRISRLLILDSTDACVAILHRSVFTEMLANGLRDSPPVDPAIGTLAPLLVKPYSSPSASSYGDFISKTIAFVAEDRSLADAKAEMERIPMCQDVIVTKSGNPKEPVIGWISNIDIGRLSQA